MKATETELLPPSAPQASDWPLWQKLMFRFVVAFMGIGSLHLLPDYIVPGAHVILDPVRLWWWRRIRDVRRAILPDQPFDSNADYVAWVLTVALLACLIAAIWSGLDRRRPHYRTGHAWLRLYLRCFLALVMLSYGAHKIIPVQFPAPPLMALITPLGQFERSRLMWLFMGASPPYVIVAGILEVAGAVLLIFRRTTVAGAMLAAAVLSNVLAMNIFYDVNVKFPATIYLVGALILIAPRARDLLRVLLADDGAERRSGAGTLLRIPGARSAVALALTAWVLAVAFHRAWADYRVGGDGAPLPPLYGLYDLEAMPPPAGALGSVAGPASWRVLAISERGSAAIQDERGQVTRFEAEVDTLARSMVLHPWADDEETVRFLYDVPEAGILELIPADAREPTRLRFRARDLSLVPLRRALQ